MNRAERPALGVVLIRAVLILLVSLAAGCRTPGALPNSALLLRDDHRSPWVPDEVDHAAADLAVAALGADPASAARALTRIESVDTLRRARGRPESGLVPLATDLYHSAAMQGRDYRKATIHLLERSDLPADLRSRLEQEIADDPLALANARIWDARVTAIAKAFNSLAEPLGRSVMTFTMAPYRIAKSLAMYALELYSQEPLPLQRRQALVHWKRFLARYPEAPESPEVGEKVAEAEYDWRRTRYGREMRAARSAMDDTPELAARHGVRALRVLPDSAEAESLVRRARDEVRISRAERRWSLDAPREPSDQAIPAGSRILALAMLKPGADLATASRTIDPEGPLGDEARFALAIARGEAGREMEMLEMLRELADEDSRDSNMARHADTELADAYRNAYGLFERARRRDRFETALWVVFGPWIRSRPSISSLPKLVRWAFKVTALPQNVIMAPLRLINLPWTPDLPTAKPVAVQARRYLAQRPGGERSEEVRDWLEGFEEKRGNWIAALRVAEERADADPARIEQLREKAALQAYDAAAREDRRDFRHAMLLNVATKFTETEAGQAAGSLLRKEVEAATPHHIRITRGFLEENPDVAGPEGLRIDPLLLDGDASNGEIHPDGVALVGGRDLEFSLVNQSGDEDDPPEKHYETLSEQRFARLVSLVEETSFHNSLVDKDDAVIADSQRDVVFERARLGLADDVDHRPAAAADFSYEGMRERYGMVRSRKPLLPFDLVVKGSLSDLSLGAFPRMRKPAHTPDAFLYK